MYRSPLFAEAAAAASLNVGASIDDADDASSASDSDSVSSESSSDEESYGAASSSSIGAALDREMPPLVPIGSALRATTSLPPLVPIGSALAFDARATALRMSSLPPLVPIGDASDGASDDYESDDDMPVLVSAESYFDGANPIQRAGSAIKRKVAKAASSIKKRFSRKNLPSVHHVVSVLDMRAALMAEFYHKIYFAPDNERIHGSKERAFERLAWMSIDIFNEITKSNPKFELVAEERHALALQFFGLLRLVAEEVGERPIAETPQWKEYAKTLARILGQAHANGDKLLAARMFMGGLRLIVNGDKDAKRGKVTVNELVEFVKTQFRTNPTTTDFLASYIASSVDEYLVAFFAVRTAIYTLAKFGRDRRGARLVLASLASIAPATSVPELGPVPVSDSGQSAPTQQQSTPDAPEGGVSQTSQTSSQTSSQTAQAPPSSQAATPPPTLVTPPPPVPRDTPGSPRRKFGSIAEGAKAFGNTDGDHPALVGIELSIV